MSGFDPAKVDEAFFAGTSIKSNFLVNLGYGDPAGLFRACRACRSTKRRASRKTLYRFRARRRAAALAAPCTHPTIRRVPQMSATRKLLLPLA